MGLLQDHDEPYRTFATRVRSKAETCNFTTVCECECGRWNLTNYTKAIKNVVIAGMGEEDITSEVFSSENILSRSSYQLICLIESKEMGRHATENSRTVSKVSSFQHQKKGRSNVEDKSRYVRCQGCNKLFYPFNHQN